jgi:hypothetical protein
MMPCDSRSGAKLEAACGVRVAPNSRTALSNRDRLPYADTGAPRRLGRSAAADAVAFNVARLPPKSAAARKNHRRERLIRSSPDAIPGTIIRACGK